MDYKFHTVKIGADKKTPYLKPLVDIELSLTQITIYKVK